MKSFPIAVVIAFLFAATAPDAAAQGVALEFAGFPAVRPGTSNTLRLEKAVHGFTAWAGVHGEFRPESRGDDAFLHAALPALPPSRFPVRIASTNGLSPWRLVLVDPMPALQDTADPARPMGLKAPVAVDGWVPANGSRSFELTLARRERVVVEVVARRVGSALDPRLRVLDAAGREVAVADDVPGLEGDAWIEWVAPAAGRFRVEVSDTLRDGGPRHRFRLRLHAGTPELFPHAGTPAAGHNGPVLEAPAPDAVLPVPCTVRTRFGRAGETLSYRFRTASNAPVRVEVRARSAGSRADVSARLLGAGGGVLAESDATRGDDGMVEQVLGPGEHRVAFAELSRGAGPGYGFEFDLLPGGGDVVASVDRESLELAPGTSGELKVTLNRRGHEGEVVVGARDVPGGVRVEGGKVDAKKKEGVLKVVVPADARPGGMMFVRLEASGVVAGQPRAWPVHTRQALRGPWPDLLVPPPSLDGVVTVGIRSK